MVTFTISCDQKKKKKNQNYKSIVISDSPVYLLIYTIFHVFKNTNLPENHCDNMDTYRFHRNDSSKSQIRNITHQLMTTKLTSLYIL